MLFLVPPGHAALYSCTNAAGTTVITDSPAQPRHCTLLWSGRAAAPERIAPAPAPSPRRQAESEASHDQTQASVFSVPLERIGSLLVVTIQVNGIRPAKMILDTGASHTILSYAVARDLGLWSLHRSASMTMHTASGTVQAEILPITSITIGDAVVRNTEAVIHDLPEAPPDIEGLLGLNVLHHFTVTLDTARNRLLLGVHP
ncbi:MAG: retroviral-like aspartic protease family protein [Nitrospira sp.]